MTLRLRREISWCWHQRTLQPDPANGKLPPPGDPAAENLDLTRYENQKKTFFAHDPAARYLTDEISSLKQHKYHQSRWRMVRAGT